jgi:hypothetical protein
MRGDVGPAQGAGQAFAGEPDLAGVWTPQKLWPDRARGHAVAASRRLLYTGRVSLIRVSADRRGFISGLAVAAALAGFTPAFAWPMAGAWRW